ncbi:MAG: AmmeMemoRadiSam system radical SAM enzyme [Candidatus Omnitrophica bacterium CG_4_10_14_0_2_um_filter_44_9]|nr:MAG: AmmeMemoRadiSam system radical SAM enzyme [Candidatus Omnitrophica bacterium CG_4_10_14_0_2_um_filter_44_9]
MAGATVRCFLCPRFCVINDNKIGFCGVRANKGGKLYAANYGRVASVALDPIEKKPLYHFHPGSFILSAGTLGCNLSCLFCQNWSISKEIQTPTEPMEPRSLVSRALKLNSFGIAYTYNEPFIWYEFVLETAKLAKASGLKNVLVTNGYVNPEPLAELLPYIDAMNIDLKSIRDGFYKKVCAGSVGPVLETISTSAKSCHVELTNLIIPTLNDTEEELTELVDWIYDNVGESVPLHFSRYFPCYKMNLSPTPLSTLKRAEEIARKKLKYVYLGNI